MVLAKMPGEENLQELGQLDIATFINPAGLEALGNNYLQFSQASGNPLFGQANQDNFGQIMQGWLEGSNVKSIVEMIDLIQAQKAYECNMKVIQKYDQMLRAVTDV